MSIREQFHCGYCPKQMKSVEKFITANQGFITKLCPKFTHKRRKLRAFHATREKLTMRPRCEPRVYSRTPSNPPDDYGGLTME